jgi:hypothetical protein
MPDDSTAPAVPMGACLLPASSWFLTDDWKTLHGNETSETSTRLKPPTWPTSDTCKPERRLPQKWRTRAFGQPTAQWYESMSKYWCWGWNSRTREKRVGPTLKSLWFQKNTINGAGSIRRYCLLRPGGKYNVQFVVRRLGGLPETWDTTPRAFLEDWKYPQQGCLRMLFGWFRGGVGIVSVGLQFEFWSVALGCWRQPSLYSTISTKALRSSL